MSQENVELVRSIYAAWERGDFSRPADWAHSEIEFVFADGPTPGSWTGLAGLAEAWRDWLSAWEDFGTAADEYRDLDEERVLVLVHNSGRGKASGVDLGQLRTRPANLFHLSDGKVTRLVVYMDRESALADLGLASEVTQISRGSSPVTARDAGRDTGRAMSQENAAIMVGEWFEAWNRRDLETMLACLSPEWEWHTAQIYPGNDAVYRGRDGFAKFAATFREAWESIIIEAERIEVLADSRVLALMTFYAKGKGSGVSVTSEYANVFTLRDGLITDQIGYADWDSALEAVGLRE